MKKKQADPSNDLTLALAAAAAGKDQAKAAYQDAQREMFSAFAKTEHEQLRYGALTWREGRFEALGAEQLQLEADAADAVNAAVEAKGRVPELVQAAEEAEPSADEIADCDAEVVQLQLRHDELVGARRLAHFEGRLEDADAIRGQLAATKDAIEAAVAQQAAVRDRVAKSDRLRAQARRLDEESERLLDLAEEKRAEIARLPEKIGAVIAQSDELIRRWAFEKYSAQQEPEIPGFMELPDGGWMRAANGLYVTPDGLTFNPANGAVARLAP